MIDVADRLIPLGGSDEEPYPSYRPRRAVVDAAEPDDEPELEAAPPSGFEHGSPAPIPSFLWTAPVGPPAVAALAIGGAGANGAPTIARELDRLIAGDARWTYLNAIPGGKKNSVVDHLVVGPGGVFTINARQHHYGRGSVGGRVRTGVMEAQRAAKLLSSATRISIRVQGLVVPVGHRSQSVKQRSRAVEIVNHLGLVDFFRNQPAYLDAVTRSRVIGCARLSSTWTD